MNDTLVNQLIETSLIIGTSMKNTQTLIPNVPNTIIGAGIMLIYGLIHRAIEKNRLRKKGLLVDKKIKDSKK